MQAVIETDIYLRDARNVGLSEKAMTMAKKQTPGERMIASAKQALAFAEGADKGCVVHFPDEVDVARIRKKLNMSQRQFASYFAVSVRTVQEWEQGRSVPSGPARAFLMVIDREPQAVRRALLSFPIAGKAAAESQPLPSSS
jgi:putative transcriptional regulator